MFLLRWHTNQATHSPRLCEQACDSFTAALSLITEGVSLPSSYVPVFLHTDERGIDEVLNEEPGLEFARADNVGDEEAICAVITEGSDAGRRLVRVAEDQLVRLEQPGQVRRDLLEAIWGPRHLGDLRHV